MDDRVESLRNTVRYLGARLGDVIRLLDGEDAFRQIEDIRQASVQFHKEGSDARARLLADRLAALSPAEAARFAHSFACFLQITNIAEDHVQAETATGRPDTLAAALDDLSSHGVSREDIAGLLNAGFVAPVITAHPSEIRRKSVIDRQSAISDLLLELEATAEDAAGPVHQDVLRQVGILWRTRLLRKDRIGVRDEIDTAVSYLERSFLKALPPLYADWEATLAAPLQSFLKPGSWVGGDRDGNPNVNAEVLTYAFEQQSGRVIDAYLDDIHALGAELSLSIAPDDIPGPLAKLAAQSRDEGRQRSDEPFRRALTGVYARLAETRVALTGEAPRRPPAMTAPPYATPAELKADLVVIQEALLGQHGDLFASGPLPDLIRAVDVFGFHLARLDLRQNSAVHERVVAELLRTAGVAADYQKLDEAGRRRVLLAELDGARLLRSPYADYSDETRKELDTLAAAADARRRFGDEAIRSYIVSNTTSASDLLEVYLLLKEVGVFRPGEAPASGMIAEPLFETIGDLEAAPDTMTAYLSFPLIRRLLASAGVQEIMIGYSDSNKDGSYLTSVWRLNQASTALRDVVAKAGLRPQFFHGRGGAVGRGGGSSFDALVAQPAGTVGGRVRVTEQGEVVANKYGDASLARRSLEALSAGVVIASLKPRREEMSADTAALMDKLAATSRAAYRSLVYETKGFVDYFYAATPITEIADLNIGSRPTSRTGVRAIESLRAIPWVFSWSQSRTMLPGWFGFGSAANADGVDMAQLKDIHAASPFFQTMIANMEMVLAKSDMGIAHRYADLVEDRALAEHVFGVIRREWEATREAVLAITGASDLLAGNPYLAAVIRARLPYIDPLNHLQIDLIRRRRAGDENESIREGLHLTLNGIAAGLRNAG